MSLSQWKELGEGGYNKTYVDAKKEFVLKIIRDKNNKIGKIMDDPERSVRLWNEINPHLPKAKLFSDPQYGDGWICPYIEGKQASDEEISRSLIKIYTRTSRIITDGLIKNNFKRTPSGEVECVDIGLAFLLEKKAQSGRRSSDASLYVFDERLFATLSILENHYSRQPLSANTIKALLFIQETNPSVIDVLFLIDRYYKIKKIAKGYNSLIIKKIITELDSKNSKNEILVSLKFLQLLDPTNVGFIRRTIQELQNPDLIDLIEVKKSIKNLYKLSQIDLAIYSSSKILNEVDLLSQILLDLQKNNFEFKKNIKHFYDLSSESEYNEINYIFEKIIAACPPEKINNIAYEIGKALISDKQYKYQPYFHSKIAILESLQKVLTKKIFENILKNKIVINDVQQRLNDFESKGNIQEIEPILTSTALEECLKDIIYHKMKNYLQKKDFDNLNKLILMLKKSSSFNDIISYSPLEKPPFLMEAIAANAVETVKLLINAGANRDIHDEKKQTVLDIAFKNSNPEILTFLLSDLKIPLIDYLDKSNRADLIFTLFNQLKPHEIYNHGSTEVRVTFQKYSSNDENLKAIILLLSRVLCGINNVSAMLMDLLSTNEINIALEGRLKSEGFSSINIDKIKDHLNKYNMMLINEKMITIKTEIDQLFEQLTISDEKNINVKLKLLNKFQGIFDDAIKNKSKWLQELQNGFFELNKFDYESKDIKPKLTLIINGIADTISKKILSPFQKRKVKSNLQLDVILKLIDDLNTQEIETWINIEKSLKTKKETLKNLSLQLTALKKQDNNIDREQKAQPDVPPKTNIELMGMFNKSTTSSCGSFTVKPSLKG